MSHHQLLQAHHDGSRTYVSHQTPTLGDTVTVRLRVPKGVEVPSAHVRYVVDGEPNWVSASVTSVSDTDTWLAADIVAVNPVTTYRWLLAPFVWLNQNGLVDHDPTDAHDFRLVTYVAPPAWAGDTNFYQVYPDRFDRGPDAADRLMPEWADVSTWADETEREWPAAMTQMYGGDFAGIAQHTDHFRSLGIGCIWTTPFFPAQSNHRYDAATFDHVDPLLGGDEAFIGLIEALHGEGIRLIGDLTTNHTGIWHQWFRNAQADVASTEAGFYTFFNHPNEYQDWLGAKTLAKLNHESVDLANYMYVGPDSVVGRFLKAPFHLDGWRIDVANMTGRQGAVDELHRVARQLRETMHAINPEAFVLAEHCHDASGDLDGDGWYATMNYAGFTNPVWSWLGNSELEFFGMPIPMPVQSGHYVAATMTAHAAAKSWRTRRHDLSLLTSHDTRRFRTIVGGDRQRHEVGVGMMIGMPGLPIIFQGDEFGMEADHMHTVRSPVRWDAPDTWDQPTFDFYRSLFALRSAHSALRHGGFRWASVGTDHLCWLREDIDETILCLAVRRATDPIVLPAGALGRDWRCVYGTADLNVDGGDTLTLSTADASFTAWTTTLA
jgi:alpha-glucosidase